MNPVVRLLIAALVAVALGQSVYAQDALGKTLASGDLVRITIYGQPDMTTVTEVSVDNNITFPFLGRVTIGGLAVAAAQSRIAQQLQEQGIVQNAQVNLLVEREAIVYNYVTLLGQVAKPGRYRLGEKSAGAITRLAELLAAAGGTRETAAEHLWVMQASARSGSEARTKLDLASMLNGENFDVNNPVLSDGDVVVVPETDYFFVYGQVRNPGRYVVTSDMSVMQALAVAGGLTARGNESALELSRSGSSGTRKDKAKLTDSVGAQDVLFVKERFF